MRPGRHRRRAVSWLLAAVVLAVAVGTTLQREGPSPSPPAHAPNLSGLIDDVDTEVSARRIAYQVPTSEERRAAAAVFAAVASGDSERAAEAAADIGYGVVLADADGETVRVLRDVFLILWLAVGRLTAIAGGVPSFCGAAGPVGAAGGPG